MATMNISLPDTLRGFVENRVVEGNFGTVSEYIRELVRADQKRKAQERLEELLVEGLESGTPMRVTPDYIKTTLADLIAQHGVTGVGK